MRTRNQAVWFKKKPTGLNSMPNAVYLRPMGRVGSHDACGIRYQLGNWTVKESEIKTTQEAMAELKVEWSKKISDCGEDLFKKTIAEKLQISAYKLRKIEKMLSSMEQAK